MRKHERHHQYLYQQMPGPLSQALKYVHRLNERNQQPEAAQQSNDGRSQRVDVMKALKQEIQPDIEHLMSLFDKMKENLQQEIEERRQLMAQHNLFNAGPSNDSGNSINNLSVNY